MRARDLADARYFETLDVDDMAAAASARGVEFVDAPEERPYGIDSSFRDPSGNHLRLMQPQEAPVG
jgi:predicted enzyme related to lactoylglutathione lyase